MRFKSGFTLLEVLVALALLAGVATTALVTFNRHLALAVEDRETTTALLLARSKLDDPDFLTSSVVSGTFAPEHPSISWQRIQTDAGVAGLKRYQLSVSWQSGKRSLILVTYGR